MKKIVKEYYEHTADFGEGRHNMITGYTAILKVEPATMRLRVKDLVALFNEVANDFGNIPKGRIHILYDSLEINDKPKRGTYTKIPGKHMTAEELDARMRSK